MLTLRSSLALLLACALAPDCLAAAPDAGPAARAAGRAAAPAIPRRTAARPSARSGPDGKFAAAAPAVPKVVAAKVSPCGNVLYLRFTDAAGNPTDVANVGRGAVLTVNGVPRDLGDTSPFWPIASPSGFDAGSWVQYPLGPPVLQRAIPAGDGSASPRYAFSDLPAGRYRISANIKYLAGPGRTKDAIYTVLDSDGTTVLGTFHVDQTRQDLPFDRVDGGARLTDLGIVTSTGQGLAVVVANGTAPPPGASVADTFTRADSATVGNGWVPLHAGIWSIASNTLVATADGTAGPTDGQFDLLRPVGEDALNQQVEATTGPLVGPETYFAVLRYNRTTHDKYFCYLGTSGMGLASSIGGTSAALGGGGIAFGAGAVPAGHKIKVVVSAAGSSPTTLAATATDATAGTTLGSLTRADGSATLQGAGGAGVTYGSGTAGVTLGYSGVVTRDLGAGAGAGSTLAADILYAETAQARAVPAGATVTLDAPAGTFTLASGDPGAIAALPVKVCTADTGDWLPAFDPAAKHPMVVGYNRAYSDNCCLPNRFYFNALRGTLGPWQPHNQAIVPTDQSTGELTGRVTDGPGLSGGRGEAKFVSNLDNGDDAWGFLNQPRSTRWRVEGDFTPNGEADGKPEGFGFTASTAEASIANVTDPALVAGSTTRWFVEADIAVLNVPGSPAGFNPAYSLDVSATTVSQMTNLAVTDVGNHRGWTGLTHPEFQALLKGKGFGDLRQLDALPINFSSAVDISHLAPATGRFCSTVARYIAWTHIKTISPVDLTAADADDARKWFRSQGNRAVVRVVTDTPHGLATGQRPQVDLSGFPGGQGVSWPSNVGGQITFNSNYNQWMVIVLDPTTLLMQCQHSLEGTGDADPPATLAAAQDMTQGGGTTVSLQADPGEPIEDCIRGAVEVGMTPWVNVPLMLSPDAITAFANRILAVLPRGQAIRVEHYNEPWNNLPPSEWLRAKGINYRYLQEHNLPGGQPFVGDPISCYAFLAHRTFELFRAAWVAAGRPATDVIRVLGTQAGYPEYPTMAMLGYTFNAGKMFDELAGDGYESPVPTFTRQFGGNTGDAFGRLDVDGTISALGPITVDTGRSVQVGRQIAMLTASMQTLDRTAPQPGQTWPPAYFANVRYVQYESGRDRCGLRPTGDGRRDITLSHAVIRHPRMYALELARLQANEQAGVTRQCRFTLNLPQTDNANNWFDLWAFNQGTGTGANTENGNPFDATTSVSQTAGAMRRWAAMSLAAPPATATAYTLATAAAGTVGTPQAVAVTPNNPYTGTITLAATRGTLGATVFTFPGNATPQATTYTPTSTGTGVITGTNGGSLADPPAVGVTIAAAATPPKQVAINLATASPHLVTLTGPAVLSMVNGGVNQQFTLVVSQDSRGGWPVTWFAGIRWPGGVVPALTKTANKSDVFTFIRLGPGQFLGAVVSKAN